MVIFLTGIKWYLIELCHTLEYGNKEVESLFLYHK